MKQYNNFAIKNRGFGLVEVLVAAMIIIIIVGSVLALVRAMVKRNVISAERVQAYNLAREGLEIARSARDTSWIDQQVLLWDNYLIECNEAGTSGTGACIFIKNNNGQWNLKNTENNEKEKIPIDNIDFIRTYHITPAIVPTNEILTTDENGRIATEGEAKTVVVTISWGGTNNDANSISAATLLTLWKPGV